MTLHKELYIIQESMERSDLFHVDSTLIRDRSHTVQRLSMVCVGQGYTGHE